MKPIRIVSVDFDGVLHPTEASDELVRVPHFGWLLHLERLLAPHPHVQILVHSTWRHRFDTEELRLLLGDRLGPRVVAATPAGDDRWAAIQTWVAAQPASLDLLILDDARGECPETMRHPLVVCDPSRGLSEPKVQAAIRQWLEK